MSSAAPSIISALARVHDRLARAAANIRKDPAVVSVATAVTPRHYEDGDRVECYVDAELASGNSVGLWLDIRRAKDSWVIESSIRHNTGAGENELVALHPRHPVTDDEFMREVQDAASALSSAAAGLPLDNL